MEQLPLPVRDSHVLDPAESRPATVVKTRAGRIRTAEVVDYGRIQIPAPRVWGVRPVGAVVTGATST